MLISKLLTTPTKFSSCDDNGTSFNSLLLAIPSGFKIEKNCVTRALLLLLRS